jgi:hypothetical protein
MARALVFRYGNAARSSTAASHPASPEAPAAPSDFAFGLEKIDRKKLYGYVDTEVVDAAGRVCELATLAGDGRTLFGRGGSAFLQLDPDGNYLERQSLTPVGQGGEPVSKTPSSFDAPIALSARASIDELLNHSIKAAYALTPPMGAAELLAELRGGSIYTFPFSYRSALYPHVGFLLSNPEGAPFLLIGELTRLEFISLAEISESDESDEVEPDDEDGDVDFAMM